MINERGPSDDKRKVIDLFTRRALDQKEAISRTDEKTEMTDPSDRYDLYLETAPLAEEVLLAVTDANPDETAHRVLDIVSHQTKEAIAIALIKIKPMLVRPIDEQNKVLFRSVAEAFKSVFAAERERSLDDAATHAEWIIERTEGSVTEDDIFNNQVQNFIRTHTVDSLAHVIRSITPEKFNAKEMWPHVRAAARAFRKLERIPRIYPKGQK